MSALHASVRTHAFRDPNAKVNAQPRSTVKQHAARAVAGVSGRGARPEGRAKASRA